MKKKLGGSGKNHFAFQTDAVFKTASVLYRLSKIFYLRLEMKKLRSGFLFFCLGVKVSSAQVETVIIDSTAFKCNYKISFLGRTVEYGEQISYSSTHHSYSKELSGVIDTTFMNSFFSGDMGRFVDDSLVDITTAEVVVQSCDGKKKYEIESTLLEYFNVNGQTMTVTPLSFISEGAFIDLQKSFAIHNEFEKFTIVLKGVPDYIYLYILIGIDRKE